MMSVQGRIQDFKLGGGPHIKKSRRAEGDAKIFWGGGDRMVVGLTITYAISAYHL
jgi:hypothetical protein